MKKDNLNLNCIITREKDKVVANEIDGETVMVSIDTGEYYGLEGPGNRIWEILEDEITIKNLLEKLKGEYKESEEKIKKETMGLLMDFFKRGIIKIVE